MINHGYGVSLERIRSQDIPRLFTWRNDPRVSRYCRQFEPLHLANHEEWFRRQSSDPTLSMFSVLGPDAKLVGVAGLTSIDRQNRRAEFSLYIDPDQHKKKLGAMALKTLFTHGFKTLGLHSIWGETFEFNPASRLFQNLGMRATGTHEQAYFREGRFVDAHIYSLTEDQWERLSPSW